MHPHTKEAFFDELGKIAEATKFKSNSRMVPKTKANVAHVVSVIQHLEPAHKEEALKFTAEHSDEALFDILHGMRRWYAGQTMAKNLLEHNGALGTVMKLDPEDAVGVFRGFKVDVDHELASAKPGDQITLDVTRNRGLSSWSTTEAPTNKFSGGGKGKVGLIVKLVDHEGIMPLLAPPEHTEPWFNALYEKAIGTSFRPKEGEYLISAPKVKVEVVRVKK